MLQAPVCSAFLMSWIHLFEMCIWYLLALHHFATLPLCHFAPLPLLPRQKRGWNWLLAFNTRPQHPLTRLTWFKLKYLWIDNIILTSNLSSCTFLNLLDSALAAIDWLWIAILNLLVVFFLAPRTRQHSWHRSWTRAAACGGCTTCLGDREVQNGYHEKQKQKQKERESKMLEMLGETGQVWRIPNFYIICFQSPNVCIMCLHHFTPLVSISIISRFSSRDLTV